MLEIYLVRHGETPWNNEGRLQGSKDIPLSKRGFKQAERLADRFEGLNFSAIYSSNLKRAEQTAATIARKNNMEVIQKKGFREISMGDWEGRLWEELNQEYPDTLQAWKEKPTMAAIPNCEGVVNVAKRGFKTLKNTALEHKDNDRILIVAHGLLISTILCRIEKIDLDDWFQMHQGNTAVNIIKFDGDQFESCLLNCTKHISE